MNNSFYVHTDGDDAGSLVLTVNGKFLALWDKSADLANLNSFIVRKALELAYEAGKAERSREIKQLIG